MFDVKELERVFDKLDIEYKGSLNNNVKLFLDLELDSLTIVSLICYIEDEYNLSISEDEMAFDEKFTIGEFIALLNKGLD